jgi:hypothetical protein
MRIWVRANDDEDASTPVEVAVIERDCSADPASGLGLLLVETSELLRRLQSIVLEALVDQFVRSAARAVSGINCWRLSTLHKDGDGLFRDVHT